MRLFIAVNFSAENRDLLYNIASDLAVIAVQGRAVQRDNYHLTLAFIGESNAVAQLSSCIDAAAGQPFDLIASKLGYFRRQGGDIIWLGIKPSAELANLQKKLVLCLQEAGFAIEKRQFKPHLTLLRQAVMPENFDFRRYTVAMPQVRQHVNRISLMKSERIAGRLVYSEVYGKNMSC